MDLENESWLAKGRDSLKVLLVTLSRASALFVPNEHHNERWDIGPPFALALKAALGRGHDAEWLNAVRSAVDSAEIACILLPESAKAADLGRTLRAKFEELEFDLQFAGDNSNPDSTSFYLQLGGSPTRAEELPEKVSKFRELVEHRLAQLNALPSSFADPLPTEPAQQCDSAELPSNPASTESDLLDVREFAQIARVSGKTIYKLCKQPSPRGSLPHCRVGRKIRIKKAAALEWLERHCGNGPVEKLQRGTPNKGAQSRKKPIPQGKIPNTGIKRRS